MTPRIRPLCFLLLVAISIPCDIRGADVSVSTPFVSPKGDYVTGQDRYHTFRIPGLIVAADDSILAFAEARRGDGSDPRRDDNAPIDIVMRRSTDKGQTWGPLTVIDTGFRPDGDKVDFGDPTPVLDATTGTLFLLYGQMPDLAGTNMKVGQSHKSQDGNHVVWVRSSTNNGKSWSPRQQIDYPDEPDETSDGLYWRQAEPGPGNGIQLQWQADKTRNGRLLVPAKRAGSTTPEGDVSVEPFVYFSDDHGETWQVGHPTPGPAANESEVVELTDGQILLDARQQSGDFRRRHLSSDGGQTWGADRPDQIPLAQVDGSLARYSARRAMGDRDRIFFTSPRGGEKLNRNNITLWTSYDEGKTFGDPVQLNQGFAAYSVVSRLPDGSIGMLVETVNEAGQEYGTISFLRFGIDQRVPKE